jgi:hypothetical protein
MDARQLLDHIREDFDLPSDMELARRLGVQRQNIHHWRRNNVIPPGRIIDIHLEFGIPVAAMVGERAGDIV